MALDPAEGLIAIQSGTLMYWLRRGLGDAALAVKLEELVRQHALDLSTDKEVANAMLVMRAIADADIFMPLCWRGLALFPDGLGPALAAGIAIGRGTRSCSATRSKSCSPKPMVHGRGCARIGCRCRRNAWKRGSGGQFCGSGDQRVGWRGWPTRSIR